VIKVYKIQNKKNNMFWTGKYKKCDEKGKVWYRVEELTKDLKKIKKIPKEWVILEFEVLPLSVIEIPIPF